HSVLLSEQVRDRDAQLWASLVAQSRAQRTSRQPGQRIESLKAIREALKLPIPKGRSADELRAEAIAALCLPDIEMQQPRGYSPGLTNMAFDATCRIYARGDQQGHVSVRGAHDDEERFHLRVDGGVSGVGGLQFSRDGRFLFCRYEVGAGYRGRCW